MSDHARPRLEARAPLSDEGQPPFAAAIGVATRDFSLLYDILEAARRRGLSPEIFEPGDTPPSRVAVVITTAAESGRIAGTPDAKETRRPRPTVIGAEPDAKPVVVLATDPEETLDRALAALRGDRTYRVVVVGVDPGERPGVAVIGDGRLLATAHARSPEAVAEEVERALASYRGERFLVRVGRGAPTMRDRILRDLAALPRGEPAEHIAIELVDESRSTPVVSRSQAERDIAAAKAIALARGEPFVGSPVVRPSEGELRDLQRKSRIASAGRVTISRSLARAVALGRISLDQAVARQLARGAR